MDGMDILSTALGAVGGFLSAFFEKEIRTQRPLRQVQSELMTRRECELKHKALERQQETNMRAYHDRLDRLESELKSDIQDMKLVVSSQGETIISMLMRNGFRREE